MSPVFLALLVPFGTALLCLLTSKYLWVNRTVGIGGSALLLIVSIVLLLQVADGTILVVQAGGWEAPFGITLVVDMFSALMLLVTAIITLVCAIYSIGDTSEQLSRKHCFAIFHFLILGVNGAFITGDLFNMYVWFEVMLIASFVLMTMEGKRDQLEGGVKYLIINLFSSLLFLTGVGLIYGKLGTLNMADIAVLMATSPDALLVSSSSMLLFVAFSVKAALFPFFFWLPASYHTPRIFISGLFAGLLTKVGVYALIRVYSLLFNEQFPEVQGLLLFLAGATMVTGVLGAAAQFNIRKILSFHIISQIGYMILALAIGTPLALGAAIFYVFHHIIVKTNLFLISGIIECKCGSEDLAKTGNLYKAAPLLGILFFIPAFSLGGIPPLSGFWAKFTVVLAGLKEERYTLVAVALIVGILTLYSMTKIWAEAFWKKQEVSTGAKEQMSIRPVPKAFYIATIALATLTIVIGLWAEPLLGFSLSAGEQLANPNIYIEQVLGPQTMERNE